MISLRRLPRAQPPSASVRNRLLITPTHAPSGRHAAVDWHDLRVPHSESMAIAGRVVCARYELPAAQADIDADILLRDGMCPAQNVRIGESAVIRASAGVARVMGRIWAVVRAGKTWPRISDAFILSS